MLNSTKSCSLHNKLAGGVFSLAGTPVHQQINEFVGHVDHRNPHTFEVEDLEKLIKKVRRF